VVAFGRHTAEGETPASRPPRLIPVGVRQRLHGDDVFGYQKIVVSATAALI